ncbi:MAG: alpha/beta fold hydrolase [Alphaproteobacteria bacterium]|nr:alpha/beta fold hydrolase [Alphaproteobacteria bacterium]
MRTGPRPLSVTLALAASAMAAENSVSGAQNLQQNREETGRDISLWSQALLGIRSYQNFPQTPPPPATKVIWQQGTLKLHRSVPRKRLKQDAPVVLLVPSLINRAGILDLAAERSLLRILAGQGMDAVLLDWGDAKQDPMLQDLNNIVCNGLLPAVRYLKESTGRPLYLLGYCMGGTLNVAALQLAPQDVAGAIFLAAPWDFQGRLARLVQFWAPTALPHIHTHGFLPADWMQMIFAALEPQQSVHKFARFAAMDPDSDAARLFVAVEDWLNDGVDLPAGAAMNCIKDWFIENAPVRGQWRIGETVIRPQEIKTPCLIVAAQKDRLVEPAAARALHAALPQATLLAPDCGHISLIAGRRAVLDVWQPIADWIKTQHYAHSE